MKTKIPLTKKQEQLADKLIFIDEHLPKTGWQNLTEELSLDVILEKCSDAWKVPADRIRGKLSGGTAVEEYCKKSFLLGCRLFNESASWRDIKSFIGYYRFNTSDRHRWCVSGDLCGMIYPLRNRSTHCHPIATFFESLIELAPIRFDKILELARHNEAQEKWKEEQTEQEYRRRLKDIQDIEDSKSNSKNQANEFKPILQHSNLNKRQKKGAGRVYCNVSDSVFLKDKLHKENKYLIWDTWDDGKKGYWRIRGFEKDLELFFEAHRN